MHRGKILNRRFFAVIVGMMAITTPLMATAADSYPSRAIKVIVPFPPGGINDVVARPVLSKISEIMDIPVVVENKPGASGTIGTAFASKANPDGYNLLLGAASTMSVVPHMMKASTYNPVTDFVAIGGIATVPSVLITAQKDQFPSYQEFVKIAQQNPDMLTFGSAGVGTSHHTQMTFLNLQQGIELLHIPYKGSGPAMGDLLGKQISFLMDPLSTAIPQIKAGNVQPLGISSAQRSPLLPDVPTFQELGIKDFDVSTWFGLFAPEGTPPEVVNKLGAALTKALQDPSVLAFMQERGLSTFDMNAADLQNYVAAENILWKDVVEKTNMTIQ